MKSRLRLRSFILVLSVLSSVPLEAQRVQRLPLAPRSPSGEPVAPFFEGWYANPDGTYTFSFGYFNLNMEETLEIPLGPDNFIEPGEFDGKQPTHFTVDPRRDRGIFTVIVPASYADGQQRVVWTIRGNGVTYSVPARVGVEALQLDYGPRAMGSVPPLVRLEPGGMEGQHPTGVRLTEPRVATVGSPLTLTVWAAEVSERSADDIVNRDGVALRLLWFKHQGPPGAVVFEEREIVLEEGTGEATTTATFAEPGDYVLRVRVDNWAANDSSAGDQCCWTNGYVPVTVVPKGGTLFRD
ncbi:MAG: hypothetical protein IH849_10225 [Acidobacteria bacterium]|nr:hypothetical protein [Acidobacteriota bacterium]